MTDRQKFKCIECDGVGRLHSPWRVCVTCGGEKWIYREVCDTDDRMLWGARLARLDGKPKRSSLPFHIEAMLRPKSIAPAGEKVVIIDDVEIERRRMNKAEKHRKSTARTRPWSPASGPKDDRYDLKNLGLA